MPLSPTLLTKLRGQLSADGLLTRREDLFAYRYDASIDRVWPEAVALPCSREELIAAARSIFEAGVPLTCRGAGTGLSGGAVPCPGGVTLATARLRAIIEVDVESRMAHVEPGLVNLALSKALEGRGLAYAPDPSSQRTCTIGGNIAENSGGPHCLKYGVTGHHLLGLELVLPEDGAVVELGGPCLDPPGYDLLSLLCGSEGTLAVVSAARVRLTPLPEGTRTLLAVFDDVEKACRAVSAIITGGLIPAALEMIDRLTISAVEEVIRAGYPKGAEAVLLVEVDGVEAGLASQVEKVRAACAGLATEVREARDAAERTLLWRGRKEAIGALGQIASNYYIQDGCIPRSKLPEVLQAITDIGRRYNLQIANVFHAGDGNLHPVILFDRRAPGAIARVVAAGTEILACCVAVGGSLTGEHGIGLEKRHAVGLLFSAEDLALFEALKAVFDPRRIMNPTKLLPLPNSCLEGGKDKRLIAEASHPASLPPRRHATTAFEDALAARLRSAGAEGRRLRIAGSGTWREPLDPERAAVSILEHRGILEYVPEDLMIRARCGTPLAELRAAVAERGQRLALAASFGEGSGTVGGLLSARPGGGHRRPLHASERERLIGLRFITGAGVLHELGGRVPKNVAGYDVSRLLAGSRGSLALFLEATFQVLPRVPGVTIIVSGSALELSAAADRLVASGLTLAGLTLLNDQAAQALFPETAAGACRLVIGVEDEEAARASLRSRIERLVGSGELRDGPEHEALWDAIDALPGRFSGRSWLRLHARPQAVLGLALSSPAASAASRLTGLADLFFATPPTLPMGAPAGSFLRALRPWDPSFERAARSPRVRALERGVKRAFDPNGTLPFFDPMDPNPRGAS